MKRRLGARIISMILALILSVQATGCSFADAVDKQITGSNKNELKNNSDSEEVRYQDDYYEYINGDLLDKIHLDDTDAQWTWFGELKAIANEDMRQIIKNLASDGKTYEKGTSQQKIKDMYECVSNMENRNKTGLGPLQPHLDTIRNAATIDEYVDALASLSGEFGFSSIVGGYTIGQNPKDSDQYAVYLMYADTLIGKEYLENDQMQEYVDMYYDYMQNVFEEFGMEESEAEETTKEIDVLLRDICSATMPQEDYADPSKTYNVYDHDELQELYSNIDTEKMLKTLKIDSEDHYIIRDVGQAKKINSLLVEDNLELLKDFSTFVMLNDAAEYSTENYAKLSEDIDNKLHGVTASRDDEFTGMTLTQNMLPWDFAKIYVEKYFSESNKKDVENLIAEIIETYKDIIKRQDWMSDATKEKAILKLDTMNVKIGYPDEWPKSMEMMEVTPISEGGSLLSNMLVNMHVSIESSLDKLGEKVDKSEWGMTPQTINAYYDPNNNEIVFPAAILQAPFYSSKADDAANLGGIGFIIAHEISHAFDANGALYDENGNYDMWWTDEEMQKYQELSQAIIKYYDKYEVAGSHVSGKMTLAENIADLGAMTCITTIIGDDDKALDKAFGQFAYIWASVETVGYQMYLLSNDTHSPNKVRTNAVLSSCDAFYKVYDIEETDKMYVAPENRVGIWK